VLTDLETASRRDSRNLPGQRPRLNVFSADARHFVELITSGDERQRDSKEGENRRQIRSFVQQDTANDKQDYAHHNRAAEAKCRSGCSQSLFILWRGLDLQTDPLTSVLIANIITISRVALHT
jgi:hypothetical protein